MPTSLHEERLTIVLDALRARGAARILDLGCGDGPLLLALAGDSYFTQITGLDISRKALEACAQNLAQANIALEQRVSLLNESFADANPKFQGYDAAVLLETIEHIPPDRLSKVERAVFNSFKPRLVLITTPNVECNELLGVPSHRLRHPGHEFEWTRAKFETWARGVAGRNGYDVEFSGIGWSHPTYGAASQMALFVRPGT
ncbi:MAG: methyltransferase domain-containing protein [Rhodospirillaceae bacterium]|jgi:small RNA 2'-O-methyltransferase|nr:methyltransferase domain-containing protein [Rhodospirillaceae bacterium]MBT5194096.1 methyltransferase domain-containing protein [Rhodospirillaceae bacterium]MBT5896651.1 methyltransferase domain-containing protein [Rhodospirillaceae bacterium]MBT6430547.1 methyltransferase domain-containing protein [Rhodospirillaceae bacterium]